MSNTFRLIVAAAAVAIVAIVVVVVKVAGSGSDTTVATGGAHGPTTIRIVVKNGKIQGGLSHPKVKQGSRVVIRVSADVSDEVHLHGYDIARDVAPGAPAVIAFTADLPGRFETELESRKQQILDLEIDP